ncbi:peptidase C65 Otubain-domain-containing protein [Phyllosticta paracitricarpa]|uniref:ubiquitinyl hydrolase 1 n=1 Tax=Phyllosticta paracitricarpa TaxID=2016321 RepID=A0ABR1MY24_9PEZI
MTYAMQQDDDFAQLQKLSDEYQPELSGPLVGPRQSTSAIAQEYANSDPIYRAKTQNLPFKYTQYRTCRGDGHCGWRAIAFGYFEVLQRLGDRTKFLEEQSRLRSLANLLNQVGFQADMYEDFAEETFALLRKLSSNAHATDDSVLLDAFNDEIVSQSIITHLKLLTSAWIRTHAADFEPYLLGQDIRQYCSSSVEAAVCEIEHVSLTALFQVLLRPASIALEALYLDRSSGDEVSTYEFDVSGPDDLPVLNPPTIRLLYRPGHYDILYKPEDLPQPVVASPMGNQVAVNLAPHLSEDSVYINRGFSDVLAYIPGMGPTTLAPPLEQPSYLSDPYGFPQSAPPPVQPQPQPMYAPLPVTHANHDYVAPSLPMDNRVGLPVNTPGPMARDEPFRLRPSVYELAQDFAPAPSHAATLQTPIFKNSCYNTAHFLNPDFQPEEWTPDAADYGSHPRSRHKSTSQ